MDKEKLKSSTEKNTEYANTFRIGYTETEFFVDFGLVKPENERKVELISSISFPTEIMVEFILHLFNSALKYEKEFNKDLGFKKATEKSNENKQ
jgi:hypothetical protein